MTQATDILLQLPDAAWRGIEFPVMDTSEFGFSQEFAPHRIIFRDDKLIESLGRENPTYRYSVPFREDIVVGPFKNLFVAVYPEFLAACIDRSPGILIDPFHGPRRCKCASFREMRNVNRRDGVDVEVEFIVAPEESDVVEDIGAQIRTLQGAQNLAGLFDREVSKITDWDDKQVAPPEPTLDPFDFVSSVTNQLEAAGNKVSAKMHDVAFRAEKAADSIERLKNPRFASHRAAALRLQAAALRLEDTAAVGSRRPLRFVVAKTNSGLASLAAAHNMTVSELLRLNPALAKSPLVKAGTEIQVFFDTSSANASKTRNGRA